MSTETKAIFRAAIGAETTYACVGSSSPLPDPSTQVESWLPFLFDGGQFNDQAGDPELLGIQHMAGDFGGFPDEIDSLPDDTALFLYRTGTANLTVFPFSIPDFEESELFPSQLATPAGLILGSSMAVRPALTDRTVTVNTSGAGTIDLTTDSDDVFEGQILGRDINGRREISLATAVDGVAIEHAGWGSAPAGASALRVGQLFEATAHRALGPSIAIRNDYKGGRDFLLGGRAQSLTIGTNKRVVSLASVISFPVIYSDTADDDVVSGANVRDTIREPNLRRHATIAATRPRVVPRIHRIDDDPIAVNVGGELLELDEFNLQVTFELGVRGNTDGLGPGDREVDGVSFTGTLFLSSRPSTLALDVLNDARRNYHLFNIPWGPVGAHGGGVSFYATVVNDMRKLDRGKSFQRVAINVRSVSGPTNAVPLRISLF